ncbi:membrane protein [Candidatus Francisella endociliophora]|uniref:TVP38/TMEM64 family membrane protein n=1 Tax=Candidatus Francisella endociliophora TaxID=653937 RepID=A0A097EQT6_9GAMM|nr:TVP38/TMEM64 family protein [Francisella sp. FSC1006]AIT09916.1 membrane protein [Francisella sp. FSC1006]
MTNSKFYKFMPIVILIIGVVAFFSLGGQEYLSLNALKENYQHILTFTNNYFAISILVFVIAYIAVVAFSIPGATVMTLLGGLLFGLLLGSFLVVISATIGASVVFFAVRTSLGEALQTKIKGSIARMRLGFERDAFNYLMVLRLIPIFPFFVINIAAGILGVKFRDFFWATFLGIIPGSVVYVWVGTSLSYLIQKGNDINMRIILEPEFILPIVALAILSIVPVFVKKSKKKVTNYD